MVSTITTTTTMAVTSTVAASLGLYVVLLFLVLLVQKEIASSLDRDWAQRLSPVLNVALLPLGVAFLLIAAMKLMAVLG